MGRMLKYLSIRNFYHIGRWCIVIFPLLIGIFINRSQKLTLVFVFLFFIFVILRYFGNMTLLYIQAILWFIPVGLDAFLPKSLLGNLGNGLTIPECLAYASVLLVLVFNSQAANRSWQTEVLMDPIWIYLVLLTIGGVVASPGINTLIGYAMFRQSTFFFAAVVIVCRNLLYDQKKVYQILLIILISICFFLIFTLTASRFLGINVEEPNIYNNSIRLGGLYTLPILGKLYFGPNNIGLIAGMGTVLALAFMLFESKPLFSMMIALNVLALLLSGSRASLISTAVVTVLVVIIYLEKNKKMTRRTILSFLYLSVISVGLALFLPDFLPPEILYRIRLAFTFWNDPTGSLPTRLKLFQFGIGLLISNPFGIGYAQFVTMTDSLILWEQNLFLNTALGGGVLGLVGLSGFFFLLFQRGFSKVFLVKRSLNFFVILPLAPCLVFFVNSMASDPNSETSIYLSWLVLGIAFASVSLRERLILPIAVKIGES